MEWRSRSQLVWFTFALSPWNGRMGVDMLLALLDANLEVTVKISFPTTCQGHLHVPLGQ